MQMWYNDSMISSSKRREKGYRFDSLKPTCGLHLLFTTGSHEYPRCERPDTNNESSARDLNNAKGYL